MTELWQSFFQKSGNKKQAETPQNAYVNAEQWIIGKQVTFREILLDTAASFHVTGSQYNPFPTPVMWNFIWKAFIF